MPIHLIPVQLQLISRFPVASLPASWRRLSVRVIGLLASVAIGFAFSHIQAQTIRPDWSAVLTLLDRVPVRDRHRYVNEAVNELSYIVDPTTWQTPSELAARGGGDCKDLAFAKYWLLSQLGIARERMRLGYSEWASSEGIKRHMVLLLWDGQPSPLVLDNLQADIMRLDERTDLKVLFSFNERTFFDQASDIRINDRPLRGWGSLRDLIVEITRTNEAPAASTSTARNGERKLPEGALQGRSTTRPR